MASYQHRSSYYNSPAPTHEKYDAGLQQQQRRLTSDRRNTRGTQRSSEGTVSTMMSGSTGRESSATAMTEGPAYSKKIVVVGDGGCGKTCLLISYSQGYFPEKYVPTVFENYITYPTHSPTGKTVELALWDTAGQEEYDRLRPLSYPETDLIFVCFAIDCPNSLENVVDKWFPEVLHFCPYTPLILVGLKSDLRYKKTCIDMLKTQGLTPVTAEQGLAVAHKMGAAYMECSSKEMTGVEDIFEQAILTVVANDRKNLEQLAGSGGGGTSQSNYGKAGGNGNGIGSGNAGVVYGPNGTPIPIIVKKRKRKCGVL
ncbi:P-loop containing nucleoside triphosphate hydrolase protein [Lasiosphaeria ovina]|uniref:P-loop containing nucleoside triphosphate hydrolase protein n=1 Tax=Lasiosphaeria ovina TaxID=92902 RepID=A0AAE0K7G2_9PEZI|nr:P-loop containing nucleoside triphosphate hydrolase protein [Lasiosphaeria ovina]